MKLQKKINFKPKKIKEFHKPLICIFSLIGGSIVSLTLYDIKKANKDKYLILVKFPFVFNRMIAYKTMTFVFTKWMVFEIMDLNNKIYLIFRMSRANF